MGTELKLYQPTETRRAWPEEMKEGQVIMVLLPIGWTVGILDNDKGLCDLHNNLEVVGTPIMYSDILPER